MNLIKDHCPEQLKMSFALWTREAVRDLIEMRFGIRYSRSMMGRLLRRWGFTPQKPVTRAYERNDERIRDWLKREYPAFRRRVKRENAEIYWEDETGLRSDHLVGRSYSPCGKTPVIRSTGQRFGCNIISAVNNLGRMRFRVFKGNFTQSVMIDFLDRLTRDAKRKIIVIVDGHPAHRGDAPAEMATGARIGMRVNITAGLRPRAEPRRITQPRLEVECILVKPPKECSGQVAQRRAKNSSARRDPTYGQPQKRPKIVRAYFQEANVNYAAE